MEVSTTPKKTVTEIINSYKERGLNQERSIFNVLDSIRNKVINHLKNKESPPTHNDLINLVANPYMLLAAYRTTRKNKGAMSEAYYLPQSEFIKLSTEQQELLYTSSKAPDGMSIGIIEWVSRSILQGTYIWGASRRIWIPKPGTKKLRPITIPPFVDKMIQGSILMVLETIYEPVFLQQNCSFGFRAGVGTAESIVKIKEQRYTQGFSMAIEGDLESAYPNLVPEILLKILGERIKDQRFLNFIRDRLHLTLFDVKDNKFNKTFLGIPQGVIDSPYLFNIYLLGMDEYITNLLKTKCEEINSKRKPTTISKEYASNSEQNQRRRNKIKRMKTAIKDLTLETRDPLTRNQVLLDQEKNQLALEAINRKRRIAKVNSSIKNSTPLTFLKKEYNLDTESYTYISDTTLDYYILHGTQEISTTPNFKSIKKGYSIIFDFFKQIKRTRNKNFKIPSKDPNKI